MSRFKHKIHGERIDGKLYLIDAHLVEALRHVPRKLLPPLLDVLDRDMRGRHKAWQMADEKDMARKDNWMDEAVALKESGQTFANIGRILERRNYGNWDRIARALASMYRGPRIGRPVSAPRRKKSM